MSNFNIFDNLKEKAMSAYDQAKEQAANLGEDIKNRIEENISVENNMSLLKPDILTNKAINNSAQFVFEKSIEQVERLLYKYVPPYTITDILDDQYISEVINEIENRQLKEYNDKNSYDLALLYINSNKYYEAKLCITKMVNSAMKNKIELIYDMVQMDNDEYLNQYDLNVDIINEANIYAVFHRYATIKIKSGKYLEAQSVIEKCCEINPTSLEDQSNLLLCYKQLQSQIS